jgi:hypothetical protein
MKHLTEIDGRTRSLANVMRQNYRLPKCIIALAALAWLQPANAALITIIPAGAVTTTFTVTGGNPVTTSTTVNGFPITGTSFFGGGDSLFCFGTNGCWNNGTTGFSYVGTTNALTPYRIDLGGLFATAGGFFNYAPGNSPAPTISAIAADGTTVLESDDLSVLAPISAGFSNSGAFRGITLANPTIRFLQVGGAFTEQHSVTVGSPTGPATAPEPSTFLLALLPLALILRHGLRLSNRRD